MKITSESVIVHGMPPQAGRRRHWCSDVRCAVPVVKEGERCSDHDGTLPTTHVCGCGHRCYDRMPLGQRIECEHHH